MESSDTHGEIFETRLDIIIKKREKICVLIDVEIPVKTNIMQKEA